MLEFSHAIGHIQVTTVFSKHRVRHHLHADDKQAYVDVPIQDIDQARSTLQDCIADVSNWCSSRRCPGVILRYSLTLVPSTQWKSYVTSGNCLIVNCQWSNTLRVAQATVSITCPGYDKVTSQLVSVFVLSRLDYCNSLLAGLPSTTVKPLQRVQKAAVHLALNLWLRDHVTPGLQQLHWLPVEHRITFKLCMLMHLIYIGRAPRYMADPVQSIVESSRRPSLRSAVTANSVKHRIQSKFGERCFRYAGPAAWNSLPHSVKLTTDTNRFKQLLKSHLFYIAFWHFDSAPGQFVSRALQVWICICMWPIK